MELMIYDSLGSNNWLISLEGDTEAMVLMYEPQGVLVDKKNNKCSFGRDGLSLYSFPSTFLPSFRDQDHSRTLHEIGQDGVQSRWIR